MKDKHNLANLWVDIITLHFLQAPLNLREIENVFIFGKYIDNHKQRVHSFEIEEVYIYMPNRANLLLSYQIEK